MCVCRLYCLSRVRLVKLIVVVKTKFGPAAQRKIWHAGTHTRTHTHVLLPIYVHDSALGHARNVSPINSLHCLFFVHRVCIYWL